MASLNCFCSSWRKKKNSSKGNKSVTRADSDKNIKALHVKVKHPEEPSETSKSRSSSFSVPVAFLLSGNPRCSVKVIEHESPFAADSRVEANYEGEDEHDETLSMKRNNSDFSFQPCVENSNEEKYRTFEEMNDSFSFNVDDHDVHDEIESRTPVEGFDTTKSGHLSDPGIGKAEFWTSPRLKRSCSDLEMRSMYSRELVKQQPSLKSKFYKKMQAQMYKEEDYVLVGEPTSPVSVKSNCSADRVILKKHSSSQILPSRSRRLWWKLFLWSHRNLHRVIATAKPQPTEINSSPALNQQGGYSSDTAEPKEYHKGICENTDNESWDGLYEVSGMWPQNQWVAFPTDDASPFSRVDEWVQEASALPSSYQDDSHTEDDNLFPPSPEHSGVRSSSHSTRHVPEEITHANGVIQSLNSSSTVAHMTGIGLKVIPSMSHFSSLRSVNLSGNFIVHIAPGSLPKGLHTLNLSRNKIHTIEGLRDLTRLRVLDLSYNRISRIGQGFSNCTLIKELYLAGNKISNVEGLHRLLKLNVLDLSFNKITTAKALGQLVANYNSLIALNLFGNPIQSNISDDQLRKTICSLLPKLALLNKQPTNPQKARELRADAIAKAALANSSWKNNTRRRTVKRVGSQGSSSSTSSLRRSSSITAFQKSRQSSKKRSHRFSGLKEKA